MNELPEFTKLLCFFVKRSLPNLNFTSTGVRVGGTLTVHRDMNKDRQIELAYFGISTRKGPALKNLRGC